MKDNRDKVEEIWRRELINIREELEIIRNRPMNYTPVPWGENREVINFKDYRRIPLEFLVRLEELLTS